MARTTDEAQFTAIVASDPQMQAILSGAGRSVINSQHVGRGGGVDVGRAVANRLAELGIDPNEYHVDFSAGEPRVLKKSWMDKHGERMTQGIALGAMGGMMLAPAAGAAATAPAAATSAAAPAAATGTTAATTAAAGGGVMGALSDAAPYINAAGRTVGAIAAGRAANRGTEAAYNQQQDQAEALRQRSLNDQIRLDLEQRRYADDDYQRQMRNAIFGDFLSGVDDVSIQSPEGVPRSTVTGGLRPSAMANRGTVGREVYQRSMANILDPLETSGITDASGAAPNATGGRRLPAIPYLPELRDVPQATGTDRALDLINIGSAGIGALTDIWSNRNRAPQPAPIPALPNNQAPWRPTRLQAGSVSFR